MCGIAMKTMAARLLLDFGVDPALCSDQGQAPLAGAAYKGDAAMVALLLERGADVDGAMPDDRTTGRPDDRTTLMMAAMFNRCDVVDLLVRQCDRADARDPSGMTGLDVACIMDAPDTPRQLAATGRQFSFGLVYCLSNQALGRNSRRISTSSLRIASRSTCGSGGTTGSSSIAPCSARRLPSLLRAPLMVKPCS
jgi:ankyrin repeat protein